MTVSTLTRHDRDDAWARLFRFHADELSDHELLWESSRWSYLGCPWLAALSTHVMAERQADGVDLAGPPCGRGLDALWHVVNQPEVVRRCATEALPLVTSMRLWYW